MGRIPVEPGGYRLQVNVLTPDARFGEVATRLVVVARGKGQTWHSGVA